MRQNTFGSWVLLVLGLSLSVCGGTVLAGQHHEEHGRGEEEDDGAAPTVTTLAVGRQSTPSGVEVPVPVQLTSVGGVAVGRVTFDVSYPADRLEFVKAESVKPKEVVLTAGVPVARKGARTVQVNLKPAAANAKKGLSNGLVAFLIFRSKKGATPGDIALQTTGSATATGGAPLKPFKVDNGTVRILVPPERNQPLGVCFFYMH